jgi:hypothetical protein
MHICVHLSNFKCTQTGNKINNSHNRQDNKYHSGVLDLYLITKTKNNEITSHFTDWLFLSHKFQSIYIVTK